MIEITAISSQDLPRYKQEIARVYAAAFAEPPYSEGESEVERAMQSFAAHSRRGGFRLFVARDDAGRVVGFAYGYHGQPGQWWHDYVSKLLPPDRRTRWLSNCFEFVELAVLPELQGQGIGGRLHDALIEGVDYQTAVLSTYAGENRARHLYLNRGWQTLVELTFPGSHMPMVVFGLDLASRKESARP